MAFFAFLAAPAKPVEQKTKYRLGDPRDVMEWLRSRDPNERYDWMSVTDCGMARYFKSRATGWQRLSMFLRSPYGAARKATGHDPRISAAFCAWDWAGEHTMGNALRVMEHYYFGK